MIVWPARRLLSNWLFRLAATAALLAIIIWRSDPARLGGERKRTDDGYPVHSFRGLLKELEHIVKNRMRIQGTDADIEITTRRTPLQARAIERLGVSVG
jgi:hypothetical protein